MAYHHDLLEQAKDLVHKQPSSQANLRRAVSTAYYSLFHLLISETTLHWSHDASRADLGRMFDHNVMKKASQRLQDSRHYPFADIDPLVVKNRKAVAQAFVELQNKRHVADYDNGKDWTPVESLIEVNRVRDAFLAWDAVRYEDVAQKYLVSLLIKSRD